MTSCLKQRADLIARQAGDAVALYDPSTGVLSQLNATAYAIWQACDGRTTIDEISAAISILTGRSSADLGQEVIQTIDALLKQGLLERD